MSRESRSRPQIARDVARVLALYTRAARGRQLYRMNNAVMRRMMADLSAGFAGLLADVQELTLKVRPDSFVFEEELVLQEANPEESLPFAFYRDGVRRLDISEGLSDKELEVLVSASAEGFSQSGLGDDIVSYLWRHELEHVRYVVVDTTIVDASAAPSAGQVEALDLDAQIDGILNGIYGQGTQDDVGPRTVRVDASDISAKQIAETLDTVDEMAAGFHPARALLDPPAYAAELAAELEAESDDMVSVRAAEAGLDALASRLLPDDDAVAITDSLLRIYDTALVSSSFRVAARIVAGVRAICDMGVAHERARTWVSEAVEEARLRQVLAVLQASDNPELIEGIYELFTACGPAGVPSLLGLLPAVPDPTRRATLGTIAARLGIDDLGPVRSLLTNEQAFVALEGIRILAMVGTEPALHLILATLQHPEGHVRLGVLQALLGASKEVQLPVAIDLLDDPEAEVRVQAIQMLGQIRDVLALRAIENRVKAPSILVEPFAVKQAYLAAYVSLSQVRALPVLAKLFQDGGGLLAKKDAEELAIAAAQALGSLATPGAVTALKKAATFLNMKVREAANEALRRTRTRPGQQA